MRLLYRLVAAMLACLAMAMPLWAEIDDLGAYLQADMPVVLDWQTVPGNAPLSRETPLTVHLAGDTWLRITNATRPEDIQIEISEGSGLAVVVEPREDQDGLLVGPFDGPRLVRLRLRAGAKDIDRPKLATVRAEPLEPDASYRAEVATGLQQSVLSRADTDSVPAVLLNHSRRDLLFRGRTERRYGVANAGQSLSLRIEGPVRLRVETRLLPEPVPMLYRPYRIALMIDGKALAPLEFEAAWDLRADETLDGRAITLGVLQKGYINIPERYGQKLVTRDQAAA